MSALDKDVKVLIDLIPDLTLKLHYAEMVLEDVRDECRDIPSDIYQDMQTLLNSETITPRAAFLIHPDGKKEFRAIIDDMADIQAAVGGYFELIEDGEDYLVYADEDGRDKVLEPNFQASALLSEKTIKRLNLSLVEVEGYNKYMRPKILLLGPVLFVFKTFLDKKK